MQEQGTGTTPKGENIITFEYMEDEVQSERCGTTPYTDITDSEGAESEKLKCSKSHMQVS